MSGQNRRLVRWVLLTCLWLGWMPGLRAEAFAFPAEREVVGLTYQKQAQASFFWAFWRVYDGALYVGPSGEHCLELYYHKPIPAEKIVAGGNEILRRNVDDTTWEAMTEELAQINAAYVDVEPGDRYTLALMPDGSTVLKHNDELLCRIEDPQFGTTYLQIWLGKEPISARFRDRLLPDEAEAS